MSAETTNPTPSSVSELSPRMELRGTVKRLELIGAFVDIGVGTDALLHISQLNQPNVRNVEDVLKVGDEITVYVLRVDKDAGKVALSMSKPPAVTWDELKAGDTVTGTVVRVENFGVFVDIGAERPGMVHVSELANGYVKSPSDVVSIGDEVNARVLKVNKRKRQIDLSMKDPEPTVEDVFEDDDDEVPTAMELALRRAMAQAGGDEEPSAARSKSRKKRRVSQEQEDIIARTLRSHQTD
jgi:small subunit ribosomal protein S1